MRQQDGRNCAHNLAARGSDLLNRPATPAYLTEHSARSGYDDYIPLCVAENKLVWDLLRPVLNSKREVSHSTVCYDSMIGSLKFRRQLARFVSRTFLGRDVEPEHLAVLAGAGSILETMFYAIGDPGDGILVPTPSYAGFWMDLEMRDRLSIVPVHCRSEGEFRLTTGLLEGAVAGAGRPVRALLFTSPSNPLGRVYTPEEIGEVVAWAEQRELHLVFDEIYALSVFGDARFTSGASLRSSLGELIHIVWAFSKDFGLSGLRCGVLVSENRGLIEAVDALSYWACCSGDTQHLLGKMISDDSWVDTYITAMQHVLRGSYRSAAASLDKAGIPYLPAEAGFFMLCDFRRFMSSVTWEEEDRLWRRLLEEANVNLTPGSACRIGEPGFMRLCHAGVSNELVTEGVRRIGAVIR